MFYWILMGRGSGILNLLGFVIVLRWNIIIIDKSLYILKVWKLKFRLGLSVKIIVMII